MRKNLWLCDASTRIFYPMVVASALASLWAQPAAAYDFRWPWQSARDSALSREPRVQPNPQQQQRWTPRRGPVFDVAALTSTPLWPRVLKRTVEGNIVTEEVMFHSHMDGRKRVDIFAYFSYPRGGKKLPAFIWIEGGLARARPFRTKFGARRGYATLAIDFPQPGYRSTGNYPINKMMDVGRNPRQAPIYHGAVALLKAVSFLESRHEVDAERIGMAGSSWGGFYTSLMAGIDSRIKVAACMFGSGNLQTGNMWWDAYNRSARFKPDFREHWRNTLDPALRLAHRPVPIAWFTGTNDWFFWMPSVMKTYQTTRGPKHLALIANWDHALPPAVSEQVFAWLDVHLKKATAFNTVSPVEVKRIGRSLWAQWSYRGRREVKAANLILSWGEAGNWHARYWKTLRAPLVQNASGGASRVRLPDSDVPFYVSATVIDRNGFMASTPLVRVNPKRFGLEYSYTPFSYDGCGEWGNFEGAQNVYLRRHLWSPKLVKNAAAGRNAVLLQNGENRLPLLRFTSGVPHRFACWMKAQSPTTVVVKFNARFNGKTTPTFHRAVVGTDWTPIEVEVVPHEDLTQRHNASLWIPEGAQVLLDAVRFRPLPDPSSDFDVLPMKPAVRVAHRM